MFPAVLIVVGGTLVVSARSSAGQVGLMVAGVVLTVLLVLGTAVDVPFGGGGGPDGASHRDRLEPEYERAIGEVTLDLSGLDVEGFAAPIDVRARVGIGELVVIVPRDAPIAVDTHAGLGSVRLFGAEEGGLDAELSAPAPGRLPVIRLQASVGMGEVRVEHA